MHYLKHDTPVCTPGHQYLEAVMLITILHPSDMHSSSKKDLKAVIINPSQMSASHAHSCLFPSLMLDGVAAVRDISALYAAGD